MEQNVFIAQVAGVMLCPLCLARRVYSPVSESAGHYETETPGEGAIHQFVGAGQGGDEGTVYKASILQWCLCWCTIRIKTSLKRVCIVIFQSEMLRVLDLSSPYCASGKAGRATGSGDEAGGWEKRLVQPLRWSCSRSRLGESRPTSCWGGSRSPRAPSTHTLYT